ncbi:hypothetical protein D3C75_915250 [compost metagenome]
MAIGNKPGCPFKILTICDIDARFSLLYKLGTNSACSETHLDIMPSLAEIIELSLAAFVFSPIIIPLTPDI